MYSNFTDADLASISRTSSRYRPWRAACRNRARLASTGS